MSTSQTVRDIQSITHIADGEDLQAVTRVDIDPHFVCTFHFDDLPETFVIDYAHLNIAWGGHEESDYYGLVIGFASPGYGRWRDR